MALERLMLMADDLTGACDAGVEFVKCGFKAVVWLDIPRPEQFQQADLTILSTDSRNDVPVVAQRKVAQALRLGFDAQSKFVYKKIDSTLRGNVGSEIVAIAEDAKYELVMVSPAYPAMGRIVETGWLKVVSPFPEAAVYLPALLREQGLKNLVHISRPKLTGGRPGLVHFIRSLLCSNTGRPLVISLDSVTQSDLTLIAEVASEIRPGPLMVGSAGLAAEVAHILAGECGKKTVGNSNAPSADARLGSVVAIVGSSNPVTTAQIGYLWTHGAAAVLRLGKNDLKLIREAFERSRCVVVTIDTAETDPASLAALAELLRERPLKGILFSGGDTANLLCRALRATGIELMGEVVPGIPWGHIVGGSLGGKAVATKAGGFGDLNAFEVISDFLMNEGRLPARANG